MERGSYRIEEEAFGQDCRSENGLYITLPSLQMLAYTCLGTKLQFGVVF